VQRERLAATLAVAASLFSAGLAAPEALAFAGMAPSLTLDDRPTFEPAAVDEAFFANSLLVDLRRQYDALPSLFFAGLELKSADFALFLRLDLREDFRSWLIEKSPLNLPFLASGIGPIADANFPSVGYVTWKGLGDFSASLGRRKLAWGPGTWSLAVSDTVPYFDHLELAWQTPSGAAGQWGYQWIVASADRAAAGASWDSASGSWLVHASQKTLAAHRLTWASEHLRLGLGELNMIYGVSPDLQDLGPFLLYHNLYQDANSNVLIDASAEATLGPIRLYGEYAMDEYVLPLEHANSRPSAMGWLWGGEFFIFEGRPLAASPADDYSRILSESSFARHGGLSLRYEHFRTTTYLYQRSDAMGSFAWPERRFTLTQGAGGLEVVYADSPFAYVTGFPWGPDHALDLLALSWEDKPFAARLGIEYHRQGSRDILSPYGEAYNTDDWLSLALPIAWRLRISLEGEWVLSQCLRFSGCGAFEIKESGTNWQLRLGCELATGG